MEAQIKMERRNNLDLQARARDFSNPHLEIGRHSSFFKRAGVEVTARMGNCVVIRRIRLNAQNEKLKAFRILHLLYAGFKKAVDFVSAICD
ncbi:7547_t:CDS:2, partial [Paraglomus occultum]